MNQERVRKVDSIEAMREALANRVASSVESVRISYSV